MAKLTVSVDRAVAERAKRYAAEHGTSVSQLVERYLQLLSQSVGADEPLPPVLKRLRQILMGVDPADYRRYLERKYR